MTKDNAAAERRLELSFLIGSFVTDHLIRVQKVFEGDLGAALVMATIANRNVKRYYENVAGKFAEGMDKLVEGGSPRPQLQHCNTNSVSSATGIPRETVRRKVGWLADKGWITVGARDELMVAAGVGQTFAEFDSEMIDGFLKTAWRSLDVLGRSLV